MILTEEVVEAMSTKALVEEELFLFEQIKLVFHELNKRSIEADRLGEIAGADK